MEDYQEVNKKIHHLEYDEIAPIKKDINDIKIQLAENNVLTNQAVATNEKLSDVIDTLKETMIEMAGSMKASNRVSEELAENVRNLSEQFTVLDSKVNAIDDKAKIDVVRWIGNNFISIILLIGALGYAITKFIN